MPDVHPQILPPTVGVGDSRRHYGEAMTHVGYVGERHRSTRAAWLRAAVLGANDGIVSTASLMLGVAGSSATWRTTLVAGLAGLVAGALSMGAGEYVSVSSQRDIELADMAIERSELARFPEGELWELTEIYVRRGLDQPLAAEVAQQLHDHDALGAHLRDELNLDPDRPANPLQAAFASMGSFAVGAALPLLAGTVASSANRVTSIVVVAVVALAALGATGARLGGGVVSRAALRVLVGGGLAMAVSLGVGRLVGVAM